MFLDVIRVNKIDNNSKYTIHRTNQIITIKSPLLIEEKNNVIKKRLFMKQSLYEDLLTFESILKNSCPHFNLNTFYNRTKTLIARYYELNEGRMISSYTGESASYYPNFNSINIYDIADKKVIFHELFHAATSSKQNRVLYSGFSQNQTRKRIGIGINEGYTSLMTNRYFDSNESGYQLYTYIMELVEEEIGQNKLEKLYSEMNLVGLLDEIKNKGLYEPFIKIINASDYIEEYLIKHSDPLYMGSLTGSLLSRDEIDLILEQEENEFKTSRKELEKSIEELIKLIAMNKVNRKELSIEEVKEWERIKKVDLMFKQLKYEQEHEYTFSNRNLISIMNRF